MKSEEKITYEQLLSEGRVRLARAGVEESSLDAWYILSWVTGLNRARYLMVKDEEASWGAAKRFFHMVDRRAERIPLQYILGNQEFMGLSFKVTPDVLIPRQDTEILVMRTLEVCAGKRVLDMCTGSGCIIISLAVLGRIAQGTGVDISGEALAVARENSELHHTDVEFIESDLFERVGGRYDIIISNPPYIASSEVESLMVEVRGHEPFAALDGGADGLDFYRRLSSSAGSHLEKGGWFLLEIGCDQGADVAAMLKGEGFCDIEIIKDYAGLDRVVACRA